MKESVLLTGGSGLLALNWVLAAHDRYNFILGLHERQIRLPSIQSRTLSLNDIDALRYALDDLEPDLVVHTAGLTSVEACEANPDLARHINVNLAENLARVCAAMQIPLVCISTDHLFSGEHAFVEESAAIAPQNVYGCTKAEAESRVLEAYPQALVVRTNFYGWGPSYRRSFSDFIIDALRAGRELNLFQDVFYTPVVSCVVVDAVHQLVDLGANGIFHIVGDERISKHEFGMRVAVHFQLDERLINASKLTDNHALVRRPRDMSLSNCKVTQALGRKLGGVDEHLQILLRQEKLGLAREVQTL